MYLHIIVYKAIWPRLLYAAIKKVVNPVYQKDVEGNTTINTNINHCQRRLNSLLFHRAGKIFIPVYSFTY